MTFTLNGFSTTFSHASGDYKKGCIFMNYIKLNFNGIMQHYSPIKYVVTAPSSTYYRTERVPTKKAVIGLISASMGLSRNSDKISDLYESVACLYSVKKSGTVITDYQTVRPIGDNAFTTVSGKKTTDAIIKTVEYLQDYKFNVYVGADDDTLKLIYDALCNPVYHQYFGKRSCIPSEPIVTEFKLISEEDLKDVYDCA